MKQNILKDKSFHFALRIVQLYKFLKKEHNEFVISKQIIRSGTAIGALIRESEYAESAKDFIHKLCISLKEANETKYWLDILHHSAFINVMMYHSINKDCEEIIKLLTASIRTNKLKNTK